MKKNLLTLCLWLLTLCVGAQTVDPMAVLQANPRKAYGNDFPYVTEPTRFTKAPKGYKPFYISHYARHGSRYYWNSSLYNELDTILTQAHQKQLLTPAGETFYGKFMAAKQELMTGVSELTQLGWEQHQNIARNMYRNFPQVFKKGGNVLAISSLSGRCVISMAAFCQELAQCNPELEIREQSSRFTLDGVVPTDEQNPVKHNYPKATPRWEQNRSQFKGDNSLEAALVPRVFKSTEGLPARVDRIGAHLLNLYTSLPNIYHEGMMEGLVTDQEVVNRWEASNLGSYSWVFGDQYRMIPILQDILRKAEAVINGSSDHKADLRFGHDSCIGPLTVLMGINGADQDPADPYQVKYVYQNWETCKACNIQLIFYRNKKNDVLVKCLLNEKEARLPVPTTQYPYYKWSDFKKFYTERCNK
jgi:hypothetical protein